MAGATREACAASIVKIVQNYREHPAFDVIEPAIQRVPFVYCSPHSGRAYPASFLAASRLDQTNIRRSEDSFVDELFRSAPELGAPLLRAHFPRAFLDVNREPYELDPRMFREKLPPYVNARSLRVAGGLGTVARIVADQEEIYAAPLDVSEVLERVESLYKPFHAELQRRLAVTQMRFGRAILIDCHSMPSSVRGQDSRGRPDIVIGDRHGTSCDRALSDAAAAAFEDLGFTVSRNRPYAGGFITEHYGRPDAGVHALQIEVNRGLYMNERKFERTAGFTALTDRIGRFNAVLMAFAASGFGPTALAAE